MNKHDDEWVILCSVCNERVKHEEKEKQEDVCIGQYKKEKKCEIH